MCPPELPLGSKRGRRAEIVVDERDGSLVHGGAVVSHEVVHSRRRGKWDHADGAMPRLPVRGETRGLVSGRRLGAGMRCRLALATSLANRAGCESRGQGRAELLRERPSDLACASVSAPQSYLAPGGPSVTVCAARCSTIATTEIDLGAVSTWPSVEGHSPSGDRRRVGGGGRREADGGDLLCRRRRIREKRPRRDRRNGGFASGA